MSEATVERLQAADSSLTRSFYWSLASVVSGLCYSLFVAPLLADRAGLAALGALAILVLQVALYLWYAVSAGAAARLLGATRWHYVTWILVAPFLALVPIPIVSTVIAVSPLSIKFLLGGQLQTAIRDATFGQLHGA